MWALTAFLESLGGTVDVTLNDIPASVGAGGGAAAAEVKVPGDPKAGKAVFMGKGGCLACHKAGDIPGTPVGPDSSQIAKIQTPDYIMKKILDPARARARWPAIRQGRDAADLRPDAHRQGVHGPRGLPAHAQMSR